MKISQHHLMRKCEYYSKAQLDTWEKAYNLIKPRLLSLACDEWLEASEKLFNYNFYRTPEHINSLLTGIMKVQLIRPEFYGDEWYNTLAASDFPISNYLRSDDELDNSKHPDAFHDIVGHVPYLYYDRLNSIMLEFASVWKMCRSKAKLLELTRIWFFLMEFSVVKSNGKYKAFGSGILTSKRMLDLCFCNEIEFRVFNEEFVTTEDYCSLGLPKMVCVFNDVDHVISSMKNLLIKYKAMENSAQKNTWLNEHVVVGG